VRASPSAASAPSSSGAGTASKPSDGDIASPTVEYVPAKIVPAVVQVPRSAAAGGSGTGPPANPASGGGGRGGRGGRGGAAGPGRGGRGGRSGGAGASPAVSEGLLLPQGGGFPVGPARQYVSGRFVSESLRAELLQKRLIKVHQLEAAERDKWHVPEVVAEFHSLVPLEDPGTAEEGPSPSLGAYTLLYKGVSRQDGEAYALRRVNGRHVLPQAELVHRAARALEAWAPLQHHPSLAVPRGYFVSGDIEQVPSLFLVHSYYPLAITLDQYHVQAVPSGRGGGLSRNLPSEDQLWSYLCQLGNALRAVHDAGLAVR
jgi:hypothetical protein